VCGYLTKEQAEIGLQKISGTFEAKS
jgi:hypothetical protein